MFVAKSRAKVISEAARPDFLILLLSVVTALARSAEESIRPSEHCFFSSSWSSWIILSTLALAFLLKCWSGSLMLIPALIRSVGGEFASAVSQF